MNSISSPNFFLKVNLDNSVPNSSLKRRIDDSTEESMRKKECLGETARKAVTVAFNEIDDDHFFSNLLEGDLFDSCYDDLQIFNESELIDSEKFVNQEVDEVEELNQSSLIEAETAVILDEQKEIPVVSETEELSLSKTKKRLKEAIGWLEKNRKIKYGAFTKKNHLRRFQNAFSPCMLYLDQPKVIEQLELTLLDEIEHIGTIEKILILQFSIGALLDAKKDVFEKYVLLFEKMLLNPRCLYELTTTGIETNSLFINAFNFLCENKYQFLLSRARFYGQIKTDRLLLAEILSSTQKLIKNFLSQSEQAETVEDKELNLLSTLLNFKKIIKETKVKTEKSIPNHPLRFDDFSIRVFTILFKNCGLQRDLIVSTFSSFLKYKGSRWGDRLWEGIGLQAAFFVDPNLHEDLKIFNRVKIVLFQKTAPSFAKRLLETGVKKTSQVFIEFREWINKKLAASSIKQYEKAKSIGKLEEIETCYVAFFPDPDFYLLKKERFD